MRKSCLGLTFFLGAGSVAAFEPTVIPCGINGNVTSSCTITATDQMVTLSKASATTTATITSSLAARRVNKVVVPAYQEKYWLAPYNDLGPLALPDYEGSGLCGRCDPPENDQYVQTVRIVQCTQNARQNTKVCSEFRETWSRTAEGMNVPCTLRATTRYNAPTAGYYTFDFYGTASRTYSVLPGPTSAVTGRNGRVTYRVGRPITTWFEPQPYNYQITKYVNRPTIINIKTTVTTIVSVFLPTTTVTATNTVTFIDTTSGQVITTPTTTSSRTGMTTTPRVSTTVSLSTGSTTTRPPVVSTTPSRFYIQVQDPTSSDLFYVRFVNNQATLATQLDAIANGADQFNLTYGFLQNLRTAQSGGIGPNGTFLVGTSDTGASSPVFQFNSFPFGAGQWDLTSLPTGSIPNTLLETAAFLNSGLALRGAQSFCADGQNNLLAVFASQASTCVQPVSLTAVPRISGAPIISSTTTPLRTTTSSSTSIDIVTPPIITTTSGEVNGISTTSSSMTGMMTTTAISVSSTSSSSTTSTSPIASFYVQARSLSGGPIRYIRFNGPDAFLISPLEALGGANALTGTTPTADLFNIDPAGALRTNQFYVAARSNATGAPIQRFTNPPTGPSNFAVATDGAIILANATSLCADATGILQANFGTQASTCTDVLALFAVPSITLPTGSTTSISFTLPLVSTSTTAGLTTTTPIAVSSTTGSSSSTSSITGVTSPTTTSGAGQPFYIRASNALTGNVRYIRFVGDRATLVTPGEALGGSTSGGSGNTSLAAADLFTILGANTTAITSTTISLPGINIPIPAITSTTIGLPGINVTTPAFTGTTGLLVNGNQFVGVSGLLDGSMIMRFPKSTVAPGVWNLAPDGTITLAGATSLYIDATSELLADFVATARDCATFTLQAVYTISDATVAPSGTLCPASMPMTSSSTTLISGTTISDSILATTPSAVTTTAVTTPLLTTGLTTSATVLSSTSSSTTTSAGSASTPFFISALDPTTGARSYLRRVNDRLVAVNPAVQTPDEFLIDALGFLQVADPTSNVTNPVNGTSVGTGGNVTGNANITSPYYVSVATMNGSQVLLAQQALPSPDMKFSIAPADGRVGMSGLSSVCVDTAQAVVANFAGAQGSTCQNTVELFAANQLILPAVSTSPTISLTTSALTTPVLTTPALTTPELTTPVLTTPVLTTPVVNISLTLTTGTLSTPFVNVTISTTVSVPTTPGAITTAVTTNSVSSSSTTGLICPTPAPAMTNNCGATGRPFVLQLGGISQCLYVTDSRSGNNVNLILSADPANAETFYLQSDGQITSCQTGSNTLYYVNISPVTVGSVITSPVYLNTPGSISSTIVIGSLNPIRTRLTATVGTDGYFTPYSALLPLLPSIGANNALAMGLDPLGIGAVNVNGTVGTGGVSAGVSLNNGRPYLRAFFGAAAVGSTTSTSPSTTINPLNSATCSVGGCTTTVTSTISVSATATVTIVATTTSVSQTTTAPLVNVAVNPILTTTASTTPIVATPAVVTTPSTTAVTAVYVTISTVYRGTGTLNPEPSTSTVVSALGTTRGTVEVFFNPRTLTSTVLTAGLTNSTSTIREQTGTTAGTVDVFLPSYILTTTTSGTVGSTRTISTPSGTVQGSAIVVIPTPDVDCGNRGLMYAIQANPYSRGLAAEDPTYAAFQARAFQTEAPQATGLTNYLEVPFISRDTSGSIYGKAVGQGANYLGVNHRGYLFAKVTGVYTFQFLNADDIALLWVGANAYGPLYARSNADIVQLYNGAASSFDQQRFTYNLTMTQGSYMPIRILYGNAGYDARFLLQIYAPDGELITNGTQTNSPYLVQYSCDGILAPMYPRWGTEGNLLRARGRR